MGDNSNSRSPDSNCHDSVAADAVRDPIAAANPRQLSEAEFDQLTLAAVRGELEN